MFSYQSESGNFAPWLLNPPRIYNSSDITAIICIRAHEDNPWVIDRLKRLGDTYQPAPRFQIIDFGSQPEYAARIRVQCEHQGFDCHHVEDSGVFSLSIARNEGAAHASTDLLYFTDIDFVSCQSHFGALSRYASEHDFGTIRDIILNLPAYHLTKKYSDEFPRLLPRDRARYLSQISNLGAERPKGDIVQFIAPYSNNFLCTRDFFMISGGYDSIFRGYGSEDFELMIRFANHTRSVQLPSKLSSDCQSPARESFFKPRPYVGFRRLGEAISYRAENAGLKTFHLWHPTPDNDSWRVYSDSHRNKLRASVAHYSDSPAMLASVDHIPKPLKALCVCKDPEHYGYFLPFRALGYQLIIIPDDSKKQLQRAEKIILERRVDTLMIFDPYIKSHQRFSHLFRLANEEIKVIVIEHGALPSTICYASDVACNDPDFSNYDANPPSPDEAAFDAAEQIVARICSGHSTTGNLNDHEEPRHPQSPLADILGIKVLLPLQLPDETAVTEFIKPGQSYAAYESSINEVAACNPGISFIVMVQQQNPSVFTASTPNVIVCHNEDSVHALIEACDFTICYNSGIGLLSLIHGKPTITIGNAFYNVRDTAHRAACLQDALTLVNSGACCAPKRKAIQRFVAWLITRKYSFFKKDQRIDMPPLDRQNSFQSPMVTHLNWNGTSLPLGRTSALSHIQEGSYVNGRLGLAIGTEPSWFDNPQLHSRGPVKSFFLKYFKRPCRQFVRYLRFRVQK